jgi:hypothetical protein
MELYRPDAVAGSRRFNTHVALRSFLSNGVQDTTFACSLQEPSTEVPAG